MLYRAGADPIRDVLAFCGPHNAGQLLDGHFLGHIWLEMDDELIDFSCGDWPHLDPRADLDRRPATNPLAITTADLHLGDQGAIPLEVVRRTKHG